MPKCRRTSCASATRRGSDMARMTMVEAIRDAHDVAMGTQATSMAVSG